ncbi:formylmethanofuran dehydrogenase subunit C [Candidatus Bathyarchaeota archaeon]|nr:formylmethanofuran dehydrogenase subunit C [Candidatus Bathyarchaeota archaeon]
MSALELTLRRTVMAPLYLDIISPDNLSGKRWREIGDYIVWEGNRKVKLRSLFKIEGEAEANLQDTLIEIVGDMSRARRIGYRMSGGVIRVRGHGGLYVGESMRGGRIIVDGDAGPWLGANMAGGTIEVSGSAGDHVAAASLGTDKGMTGGTIIVKGDSGSQTGAWMHSGLIRVSGSSGMFPGAHMRGGTIHIIGDCSGRAGANMRGGKIVLSGKLPTVLPSFTFEDIRSQTRVDKDNVEGPFYVFSGDNNEGGDGRLFIKKASNPQLKWCEKFLEV